MSEKRPRSDPEDPCDADATDFCESCMIYDGGDENKFVQCGGICRRQGDSRCKRRVPVGGTGYCWQHMRPQQRRRRGGGDDYFSNVPDDMANELTEFLSNSDLANMRRVNKHMENAGNVPMEHRRIKNTTWKFSDYRTWGPNDERKQYIRRFLYDSEDPLVAGMLPPGLTHLTFGFRFSEPLAADVLPPGLTHLTFGYDFNQPLAVRVLPPGLADLTFSREYDRRLEVVLPNRHIIPVYI